MTIKGRLTLVFVCLALPLIASAQTSMTGDITIRSDPQGSLIELRGDATVSGVTPARFRHLLIGVYDLTLKKRGYETYQTKIDIDPARQMEVDVRLSPKTRFKTAVRSLFIPGWGQRYADKTGKGWAFTFLALSAGAVVYLTEDEFDFRMDEFRKIEQEYDSLAVVGNLDDLRRVKPFLDAAQAKAYDAENERRIAIGVAVGIWALNVIDALFFFPEERGEFTVKGLTFNPSADLENVGLAVAVKF